LTGTLCNDAASTVHVTLSGMCWEGDYAQQIDKDLQGLSENSGLESLR